VEAGAKRIVDVRLNNVSQLAGFAKSKDLAFLARAVCGMDYVHLLPLAPEKAMLEEYKKHGGDWPTYEQKFFDLMEKRGVEHTTPRETIEDGCLLCSEHKPEHCHRRLVVEYLNRKWGGIQVQHLV
jgi:uncharacterized protein (DUF488 family)